jgi:hypothetical protein
LGPAKKKKTHFKENSVSENLTNYKEQNLSSI